MQSTIQHDESTKIIDGIGCEEKNIISILQGVQEHYRYLPKEVFPHIAKRLGVGEARLFSVATFYENFSLEPKGKFVIKVCERNRPVMSDSQPAYPGKAPAGARTFRDQKNTRRPDVSPWKQSPASAHADLPRFITVNDHVHAGNDPG